jgi:hypothetical protein
MVSSSSFSMFDYILHRVCVTIYRCFTSRYFIANMMYLFYCSAMILIDFSAVAIGEARLHSVYVQFALLHLSIAILYLYMWIGEGYDIFERWVFLLPDWLNLIGSTLFLVSACLYPYQFDSGGERTSWFDSVQLIEFIAVNVESFAAILWLWQVYLCYHEYGYSF